MPFLTGKVALVTGGTRGIGRSIAEKLLDAGAAVVVCGRWQAGVNRTTEELGSRGRIAGHPCDVARYEEVAELFRFVDDNFERLDILVNNAGLGLFRHVELIAQEEWDRILATNLSGAFYCIREAVPLMKRAGGGYIINIGSLAGKNAMAGGAAYNASKFGLIGLSEAAMLDLRYENIRVSYIMPGSVATEFGGAGGSGESWKISPGDVADAVLHLLQTPERTLASRIEIRPTRPPRK
jgi:NAD(P)-dependent dehydrogenase (short-subunit alcohol dehydrogenase family)